MTKVAAQQQMGLATISPALEELAALEAEAEALRATVAERDMALAEQREVVACEEALVVDRRLGALLSEAAPRTRRLRDEASASRASLKEGSARLEAAEEELRQAERLERRLREHAERQAAGQARLRRLEAEHRAAMETLRCEERHARSRAEAEVARAQQSLREREKERDRMSQQLAAGSAASSPSAALRERLEECRGKAASLQAAAVTSRRVCAEAAQRAADAAAEQGRELEEAAPRRDEEVALHADLTASESRAQQLEDRVAHMRRADAALAAVASGLHESCVLATKSEAALDALRGRVAEAVASLPESSPEGWREEREAVLRRLSAAACAEEQAASQAPALERELRGLLAARAPDLGRRKQQPSAAVELAAQAAREQLAAKGRRLKLLQSLRSQAAGTPAADEQAAAAERRVKELEVLAAELGVRLDAGSLP